MSLSSRSEDGLTIPQPAAELGLYPISVVTELTGLTPGALRGFERAGLLTPARTQGGTRRYSRNDLARLARISALVGDGINLTGVARVLALEADIAALRAEIALLRDAGVTGNAGGSAAPGGGGGSATPGGGGGSVTPGGAGGRLGGLAGDRAPGAEVGSDGRARGDGEEGW